MFLELDIRIISNISFCTTFIDKIIYIITFIFSIHQAIGRQEIVYSTVERVLFLLKEKLLLSVVVTTRLFLLKARVYITGSEGGYYW